MTLAFDKGPRQVVSSRESFVATSERPRPAGLPGATADLDGGDLERPSSKTFDEDVVVNASMLAVVCNGNVGTSHA